MRFCIRCTRLLCLIVLLGAVAPLEAQRPSLRKEAIESEKPAQAVSSPSASADKQFSVESFSTRGPIKPESPIIVTFSHDVTTDQDIDAGKAPESVFSFEPTIDGSVRWESPREVQFVPNRALRQGTEYRVRINPMLKSTDGASLEKTPEYRFSTPALALRDATQEQFLNDRRVVLALSFSDRVSPKELRKYLRLRSGSRNVKWAAQSEVATQMPRIISDPVTTDTLTVIIEPGLAGASGPLAIRNRVEKKLDLNFSMVPVSISGTWKQGRPRLLIEFSDYVATWGAKDHVQVNPPVEATYDSDGNTLIIQGDFEAEKRYTVTVNKGYRNNQGKTVMEPVELAVWMPPLAPFLELPESSGHLGTNSRMKLRIRSAAINKVNVTARRVYDSNMTLFQNGASSWNVARLGRKVAQQSYQIPMAPNQVQESEIDLRELLGPGATGIYGIRVKGETPSKELLVQSYTGGHDYQARQDANLDESAVINLSNLGIIAKEGQGEVLVFVAGLDSAEPVADIQVQVFSNKHQLLGEATTDASGVALVKNIAASDPDASPAIVVAQTRDRTEISMLGLDNSLMYREGFENSGRSFLRDGYEAFITSERGAYRPGETAHIAGFIRGRDAQPPGESFPVEVVVERPDGKTMTPQVKSGAASGLLTFDLNIPDYAPTGLYSVDVRMPGSGDQGEDNGYDYYY